MNKIKITKKIEIKSNSIFWRNGSFELLFV